MRRPLIQVHLLSPKISPLVFFAVYCLLIGHLIFRSSFLARTLGATVVFAGWGGLRFPQLVNLYPYNLIPGILGKGALTCWLLVKAVNETRWKAQSNARGQLS